MSEDEEKDVEEKDVEEKDVEEKFFAAENYQVQLLLTFVPPLLAILIALLIQSAAPLFLGAVGFIGLAIFDFRGKIYRFGRWLDKGDCIFLGFGDLFIAVLWSSWVYSEFYC